MDLQRGYLKAGVGDYAHVGARGCRVHAPAVFLDCFPCVAIFVIEREGIVGNGDSLTLRDEVELHGRSGLLSGPGGHDVHLHAVGRREVDNPSEAVLRGVFCLVDTDAGDCGSRVCLNEQRRLTGVEVQRIEAVHEAGKDVAMSGTGAHLDVGSFVHVEHDPVGLRGEPCEQHRE